MTKFALQPPRRPSGSSGRRSARSPSSPSMRMSWLYLASRSERDSEPVLIWPQLVATARSAMVAVLGLARAVRHHRGVAGACAPCSTASSVSVSVPIWLTLTRIELAMPLLDALRETLGVGDEQVVADELASCRRARRSAPSSRPSRPRPCRPRSRRSGSASTRSARYSAMPPASSDLALALQLVLAVLEELGRGAVERQHRRPRPACSPPPRSTS